MKKIVIILLLLVPVLLYGQKKTVRNINITGTMVVGGANACVIESIGFDGDAVEIYTHEQPQSGVVRPIYGTLKVRGFWQMDYPVDSIKIEITGIADTLFFKIDDVWYPLKPKSD